MGDPPAEGFLGWTWLGASPRIHRSLLMRQCLNYTEFTLTMCLNNPFFYD